MQSKTYSAATNTELVEIEVEVSDEAHSVLKAAATHAGVSLSELVSVFLTHTANAYTTEQLVERISEVERILEEERRRMN